MTAGWLDLLIVSPCREIASLDLRARVYELSAERVSRI
jgi:hypothetical protein